MFSDIKYFFIFKNILFFKEVDKFRSNKTFAASIDNLKLISFLKIIFSKYLNH